MILTQRPEVDLAKHSGEFVEHLRRTWVAQQTETQFVAMIALNLVTTKAAAEHDLLFNEPISVHSPGSSIVKLLRLWLICTVVI
jgi:hypothetical protein